MNTADKEFLIRVRADIGKALSEMRTLSNEIGKQGRDYATTAKSAQGYSSTLITLTSAMTAYLSVATLVRGLKLADQFNTLQTRLRTATKATGDYNQVSEETYAISQRIGVAIEDTVSTFQRMSIARSELGATNSEILKVTQSIQQLGVMSGASAAAMQAGQLQFAQAMTAGVVRAEEFNSIIENMPAVAERIARGLNMTVGELMNAVVEGQVLSRDVFDSLLQQAPDVAQEMESIPVNLERASTQLSNSMGQFLSNLDKSLGVTQSLIGLLGKTSQSLDNWSAYFDPTGQQQFNALVKERNQLLEHQALLEKNIWNGRAAIDYGSQEKAIAYAESLNRRLEDITRQIEDIQQISQEAGDVGVDAADESRKAQEKLANQLDQVKARLVDHLELFDKQFKAMEAAKKNLTDFEQTTKDARDSLDKTTGKPPELPGVLDIAQSISTANSLLKQGDLSGAQTQAEETYKLIQQVGEAGTAAKITLNDYFSSAKNIGQQAAQGLVDQETAAFEQVKTDITNLLGEAQKLKSIQVGFDEDEAIIEGEFLRATLQEEFNNNPLELPLIFRPQSDKPDKLIDTVIETLPGKATGGLITGPGSATSDSVLLRGSAGEYVLKAAAVNHYGMGVISRINAMALPKFADGGLISKQAPSLPTTDGQLISNGRPINLMLDGKSYPMRTDADTADILLRAFRNESMKRGYRLP